MSSLKIFADHIESKAQNQIDLLLKQELFKNCKIRIMPDVHAGVGCVIGFTGDLGDKVIPNIVGVDIGCGILTINIGKIELDLDKLDRIINQYIPSGFNVHRQKKVAFDDIKKLKCYHQLRDIKRLIRSIGTLGGGNHFIEVGADQEGYKYLIIHSGSRNLGHQVASYYQKLAIDLCSGKEEMFKEKEKIINLYKSIDQKQDLKGVLKKLEARYQKLKPSLPRELCYLSGNYRNDYLHDMNICQQFASLNRKTIAEIIINKYFNSPASFTKRFPYFETIHNYIDLNSNIIRKGAISATKGEKLLIPLNMKDGCIIGIGKGNEDWNFSAPHGAGRIMSRREAKSRVNLAEFQNIMEGIYTTSVTKATLDEAPMVYKPTTEILNKIKDTVDIIKIIKPIYNFKGQ